MKPRAAGQADPNGGRLHPFLFSTGLWFYEFAAGPCVAHLVDRLEVTYTNNHVSGVDVSSPVRYRRVFVGRVADLRAIHMGEIDFEVFLVRLNTIGANAKAIRDSSDIGGVFPMVRARIVGHPVNAEHTCC